MAELIENKNWSAEENQNLQSIIIQMNLNQNQKSLLNEQIQRFQNSEKVIQLLLEHFNNWDKFQECLIKEMSQTIEIETDWTHQELLNLHQRLSQQIESEEEINEIIQFVQLNKINVKIVEEATKFEFKTANQFMQLVGIIFEQSLIKDKQELIITQPNTEQDQTSQEQTIKDLFQEFNSINQRSNEELQNLLQQVYQSLNNKQELDLNFDNFTSSPQLQYEDLIFLCLKIKEHFSYYPRPVQLLSVIELYNHNPNQGRLAQIFTGEGKTLIIALLAILLSQKKNSNVDVVTSSPVLATRDAEQLEEFYKKFQVSVSHNIGGSKKVPQGMLPCYNSKVIYGDPHSFQADILRHEYSERGTMGDRKQEYIIVDEVDSMLIDGNSNKTLLSFMCQECLIQIRYSDQSGMKYVRQNKTYQQNKKL